GQGGLRVHRLRGRPARLHQPRRRQVRDQGHRLRREGRQAVVAREGGVVAGGVQVAVGSWLLAIGMNDACYEGAGRGCSTWPTANRQEPTPSTTAFQSLS